MRAEAYRSRSSSRAGGVILAAAGVAFALALWQAQVDPRALFAEDTRANIARFILGMFPPELSPAFLQLMVRALLETLQISVMGMTIAVAIGLPFGILATSTLMWTGVLNERGRPAGRGARFLAYAVARALLSVFRSIPEFVWALVFVRAVGLGAFAGVLAIGVAYGGMLGKVYSEILESVNPRPAEAVQATGSGRVGVAAYALLPAALPAFLSYTLYRWECAIRASAILGFVGAGGIGQQLELSVRMFNFNEVLTLLVALWVLVATVERIAARARRWVVR
jgi:phosphonate transport system permease protein